MESQIQRGLAQFTSHTDALLCEALAEEIRHLMADPDARGTAVAWLLGHLLADRPHLSLAGLTDRLAIGLADPVADAMWRHARETAARQRRAG